jgi:hypothetical protein
MDLPAPLSANPFIDINKCYMKNMKLGSFFEGGEWTGYLCHSKRILDLKFRAPMVGIRFQAKASTVDEPADASCPEDQGFRLNAEGTDGVGSFTLAGFIRSTGIILLRLRYDNSSELKMNALMTPVGMVGHWRSARVAVGMGLFWLWKREWSP